MIDLERMAAARREIQALIDASELDPGELTEDRVAQWAGMTTAPGEDRDA